MVSGGAATISDCHRIRDSALDHGDTERKFAMRSCEIPLEPQRVGDSAFWIVDKADENPALRMGLIIQDIDRQLVTNSPRTIILRGYLDFDDYLFSLQKKIHSRRPASIARGPLLWSNVIEHRYQQGAKEILEIVLVLNDESGAIGVSPLQLLKDERKPPTHCLYLKGCGWPDT
jgi:hypothetical protein